MPLTYFLFFFSGWSIAAVFEVHGADSFESSSFLVSFVILTGDSSLFSVLTFPPPHFVHLKVEERVSFNLQHRRSELTSKQLSTSYRSMSCMTSGNIYDNHYMTRQTVLSPTSCNQRKRDTPSRTTCCRCLRSSQG